VLRAAPAFQTGKYDGRRLGALNLIDDAERLKAAAAIRAGTAISLATRGCPTAYSGRLTQHATTEPPADANVEDGELGKGVELGGFEPPTSWVRFGRSVCEAIFSKA